VRDEQRGKTINNEPRKLTALEWACLAVPVIAAIAYLIAEWL